LLPFGDFLDADDIWSDNCSTDFNRQPAVNIAEKDNEYIGAGGRDIKKTISK